MRSEIEARAAAFARQVFALYQTIHTRPGGRRPADQLLDAATSAASNYRAAGRARSDKEFVAKLGVANEEADETVYWLEFIAATELGAGLELRALRGEAQEIRAIIAASYATARRNRNAKPPRPPREHGE
jgi:four helix bundle protein